MLYNYQHFETHVTGLRPVGLSLDEQVRSSESTPNHAEGTVKLAAKIALNNMF